MKNKKLSILLIAFTTSIMMGCSNKISMEDKVIDSIVIDEEGNKTSSKNDEIEVSKVLQTENLHSKEINGYTTIMMNNRILRYDNTPDDKINEGAIDGKQFPKVYVENLEIGTITDESKRKSNDMIIEWENKKIKAQIITEYMGTGDAIRLLIDDKGYIFDNNFDLKEMKSYQKLIKETSGDINRFQLGEDKNLDLFFIDNGSGIEKVIVIDTLNDKYYEISGDALDIIKDKSIKLLSIDGDKIYFSLGIQGENPSTIIGYFENNKFYSVLSKEDGINIDLKGGIYYNDNKLLFSAYVGSKYGIWRYNIESKELTLELEIENDFIAGFSINKDKNKIIITRLNYKDQDNKMNISIARLSDEFDILTMKDLTKLVLSDDKEERIFFKDWIDDGNGFYTYAYTSTVGNKPMNSLKVYYEVYKVEN